MRLAVLAVVLAGCDVLFGFDGARPPIDAPSDAADPLLVTGSYRLVYVTNDASFAPTVAERVYPIGSISFAVTLDDNSQPDVSYAADGTFSFPISHPGQGYRFVVTADGQRGELQQHAPSLHFVGMLGGRPDRVPIQLSTVQFPFPTSTGTNQAAFVLSTGLYTHSSTGQFGPTVSLDWRLATPASGSQLGLLEASKHDQIFAVEMTNDMSNAGFTTIMGVAKASITQVPGSTVSIPGPSAVARNTCARFSAPNLAEYNRIAAAAPRPYVSSSSDWYAFMAPAPQAVGNVGELWVAVASFQPAKDVDIAPTFHDPFTGMTLVIESGAAGVFNVQLPATSPMVMANVNRRWALAERGNPSACTPAKTQLPGSVALATGMTLDGTLLDTDGVIASLDLGKPIPLSWTLTPGPVDNFSVLIQEVLAVNGLTTQQQRASFGVAGQTSALLDPAMFLPGHKYVIAIISALGRPNAIYGDWKTLQMPFESAVIWSHYFEVKPR